MPKKNHSSSSGSTFMEIQSNDSMIESVDDEFVESLISNQSKLCDATVMINRHMHVPVHRIFLVRWSGFFKQVYMTNGQGPLRDDQLPFLPMDADIFELALRFFYSTHSSYLNAVERIDVGAVDNHALQVVCKRVTLLLHAAHLLQCKELFEITQHAILEFTRKFPCMAFTALDTMNSDGRQICNGDDSVFPPIRARLLQTISENRNQALSKCLGKGDNYSDLKKKRILELSAESLGSIAGEIAKEDAVFSIKAIFFWATNGTALTRKTKDMLKNPKIDLRIRAHTAKGIIKNLPLKGIDPKFVSSCIHGTDMMDTESLLELSRSSLKRALDDAAKLKEKLSSTNR